MKNDIVILVASHKEVDVCLSKCYDLIQVGCTLNNKKYGYLDDSTGDNISHMNKQYCELTALYWGWKNLECNISGLCHYRRYFVNKRFSSAKLSEQILNADQIKKYLNKKKIILPVESYRNPENPKLYEKRDSLKQEVQLLKLKEYMDSNFPEYMPSFKKYTYGNKISWGNMFISGKDIYDKYCEWVFPILFDLEKQLREEGLLYPRLMGFYAEILLCVWVDHNIKKREIKHCYVVNTEVPIPHIRLKRFLHCLGMYDFIIYVKQKLKYKKFKY